MHGDVHLGGGDEFLDATKDAARQAVNLVLQCEQSGPSRHCMKIRKSIEEVFGWAKSVGGLRKTRLIGLVKVKAQTTNHLHLGSLQPDASSDNLWLAIDYGIGRNLPLSLQMVISTLRGCPRYSENRNLGHTKRFNCSILHDRPSVAEGVTGKFSSLLKSAIIQAEGHLDGPDRRLFGSKRRSQSNSGTVKRRAGRMPFSHFDSP